MEANEIDAILQACERDLTSAARVDLKARRFWRAVGAVKRRPDLVDRFAMRIAEVDRRAFLAATRFVFPMRVGVALLLGGIAIGLLLIGAAFALPPDLAGLALLLGTGALIGATHGLAHLLVGSVYGIGFTHWYSKGPPQPQPGFKIDYASYLRAPAVGRAWMHAAGAIVTKLIPFVMLPIADAARTPWWTMAILVLVGLGQIVTDVLFSVRASDWKKFIRERRYAREGVRS